MRSLSRKEVSDILGAGVSKALLGKAVISDDACGGSIGLLGTRPSWDMMMNCDREHCRCMLHRSYGNAQIGLD
jgi:hypothetical protein